jgi:hypothetical protein
MFQLTNPLPIWSPWEFKDDGSADSPEYGKIHYITWLRNKPPKGTVPDYVVSPVEYWSEDPNGFDDIVLMDFSSGECLQCFFMISEAKPSSFPGLRSSRRKDKNSCSSLVPRTHL